MNAQALSIVPDAPANRVVRRPWGTARVTRGADVRLLSEDQSIHIGVGQMHRLENPGKVPLELIEVQTGTYLGEDDIVRVEDAYHRAPDAARQNPSIASGG